jgi:hypothetical protein
MNEEEFKLIPPIKVLSQIDKRNFLKNYFDKWRNALKLDWYFHGWEKIIIVGSFVWAVFSIGKFIFKLVT